MEFHLQTETYLDLTPDTQENYDLGTAFRERPVSLVVHNFHEKRYFLTNAAEKKLKDLQGECYVISVSGNPLVGKSSLLNLLLSFFTSEDDAFEEIPFQEIYRIGDGMDSTTQEIDMYCISKNGKNFILLDIEGDNDPDRKETGGWIYSNLIQTAVGVSHVHIYNYRGIPQETFLRYFEGIHKTVKQSKLHSEFETKHVLLKRDQTVQKELSQVLEKLRSCFDGERFVKEGLDYSMHFLPSPPNHLINRASLESCLGSKGNFCKTCQQHLFLEILLGIYRELNLHLEKIKPFKDGKEFLEAVENIVKINAKEIPYFIDIGQIAKSRNEHFQKEQLRIKDGLLNAKKSTTEQGLMQEIHKVMNDYPNLAKVKLVEKFTSRQTIIAVQIAQLEFMMLEVNKFIEKYLLDDSAVILSEEEKEKLLTVYVNDFEQLTKDIITSLKIYKKINNEICLNLHEVKKNTKEILAKYIVAVEKAEMDSLLSGTNILVSGVIGLVLKKTAIAAAIGASGGMVVVLLAVASFIEAKVKWIKAKRKTETYLDTKKIEGINNAQQAQREKQKLEDFVTESIFTLQSSTTILMEVCSQRTNQNFKLVSLIKKAMKMKAQGKTLSLDQKENLVQASEAAFEILEKFKRCL